jgi:hypothetical protein
METGIIRSDADNRYMIETLESRVLLSGHTLFSSESNAIGARVGGHGSGVIHARDQFGQAVLSPIVASSSVSAPVVAGTVFNDVATVDVINSGTAAEQGPVIINIFAAPDGTVDESSYLAATLKRRVKINAGKTLVLRLKIKSLPASIPAATYTLLAQAIDSLGATSDAASGPAIQLVAPFISLSAVVNGVTPDAIKPGKGGSVEATITNSGNIAASGNAMVDIGLSADGQHETTPLKSVHQRLKLKPDGGSSTLRMRFVVPKSETAGEYFPFISLSLVGEQATAIGSSGFTIE